jgi:hypothetical protein
MNRDKAEVEWKKWHEVCKALIEAGAITASDLTSSTMDRTTPGQRLLHTIREWGEARAALGPRGDA